MAYEPCRLGFFTELTTHPLTTSQKSSRFVPVHWLRRYVWPENGKGGAPVPREYCGDRLPAGNATAYRTLKLLPRFRG
jgi:hypothetical protein